jgi:hypothetical protein
MALFRFYGRILPPAPITRLSMKDLPSVHWEDKELGLILDVNMSIVDSEVIMTCESNLYSTQEDLSEVYKRVFDTARAAVDCFAYIKGMGLGVVLERVIPPNGIQHNILVERPELAKLVTAFDLNRENRGNNFDAMYKIAISDPNVFLAVNDLIASIAVSHQAAVNCGRAIEAMREAITPSGSDRTKRNKGWEIMRTSLNLDFKYLNFISDVSTAPRHGRRVAATQKQDFDETVKRSWIIMNRFFEYRKRGNIPLPLADFPLLS